MLPYMLMKLLVWTAMAYFLIGLAITAFCVHMSYHESAIGFGDNHDAKAQRILESKIGLFGLLFLFVCWPLALLIAIKGQRKPIANAESAEARPELASQVKASASS